MYHVSAQGVDGRMINVHYYYSSDAIFRLSFLYFYFLVVL